VQQKFLDAYDYRPCRAEPLHAIARFLRMNGRPRAAYLFAKEAAQIPYPQQDILFIDTNVYKWMALDELAATAFYVHDYNTGLQACEILLKQNRLPESEVERNQKNHAAYFEKAQQIQRMQPQQVPVPQTVPAINKTRTFKRRK
jgi:hypothetical protein